MLCTFCGEKPATHECGNCHAARYCSRECQINDWKTHSLTCVDNIEGSIVFGKSDERVLKQLIREFSKVAYQESDVVTFGNHFICSMIFEPTSWRLLDMVLEHMMKLFLSAAHYFSMVLISAMDDFGKYPLSIRVSDLVLARKEKLTMDRIKKWIVPRATPYSFKRNPEMVRSSIVSLSEWILKIDGKSNYYYTIASVKQALEMDPKIKISDLTTGFALFVRIAVQTLQTLMYRHASERDILETSKKYQKLIVEESVAIYPVKSQIEEEFFC